MEWHARSQRIQNMLAQLTSLSALLACVMAQAADLPPAVEVEGQPLAANA